MPTLDYPIPTEDLIRLLSTEVNTFAVCECDTGNAPAFDARIFDLAALRGSCRWRLEGNFHFIVQSLDKTFPSSSHPVGIFDPFVKIMYSAFFIQPRSREMSPTFVHALKRPDHCVKVFVGIPLRCVVRCDDVI